MEARLLQLSDLHAGTKEDASLERALGRLVDGLDPEVVLASGDLTHRGRREQHERAARFLRGLGRPVVAVPGNHDIPYTVPARFTSPFREFERQWQTSEPVYRSSSLVVVGLNSVRPWRHQSGGISEDQLRRAAGLFASAPDGALRVVVLHHHLLGAPWRSRKRPVSRRSRVLAGLVDAGAELVVAGHIHQSTICERREFEVSTGREHAVTVAIAPGLGQPRPRRRGEARGLHVYDVTPEEIAVATYVWRQNGWGLAAERRFPRGRDPLSVRRQ